MVFFRQSVNLVKEKTQEYFNFFRSTAYLHAFLERTGIGGDRNCQAQELAGGKVRLCRRFDEEKVKKVLTRVVSLVVMLSEKHEKDHPTWLEGPGRSFKARSRGSLLCFSP